MHRRPDEDFDKFCQSLQNTNQKEIVDKYLMVTSGSSAKKQAETEGKLTFNFFA
jgi:hypothetical protein